MPMERSTPNSHAFSRTLAVKDSHRMKKHITYEAERETQGHAQFVDHVAQDDSESRGATRTHTDKQASYKVKTQT
jgi:hypothetical protein